MSEIGIPTFSDLGNDTSVSSNVVKFEELGAGVINILLFLGLVASIYIKEVDEKYREFMFAGFGFLLALVYMIVGIMCAQGGGSGCLLYLTLFLIFGNIGAIYLNKQQSGLIKGAKIPLSDTYMGYTNAGVFILAGLVMVYYNYTVTRSFTSPSTWLMPLALVMWGVVHLIRKGELKDKFLKATRIDLSEQYYIVPSIIFALSTVWYMYTSLEIGLRGEGVMNYNYLILAMICMQLTVITAQLAFDKGETLTVVGNEPYEKVTTYLISVASLGVGALYLLKQNSCANN